jgi:hypothetical protein
VIKLRKLRWTGHVAYMEAMKSAYKILIRKPQGKGSCVKIRRGWEDNIKMGLRERGCGEWTVLYWHRIGSNGGLLCAQ